MFKYILLPIFLFTSFAHATYMVDGSGNVVSWNPSTGDLKDKKTEKKVFVKKLKL